MFPFRLLKAGCFLILLQAALWCNAAPWINSHPASVAVLAGAKTTMTVAASGVEPLSFQWQVSENGGTAWTNIVADGVHSGEGGPTLSFEKVPVTAHLHRYRVRVADATEATMISDEATLTVEYSELWGMGSNYFGQLGGGDMAFRLLPQQINTGIVAIATGNTHTLFLKSTGTLWASGGNNFGQLGDGTFQPRFRPVLIADHVQKIAAANNQSFFLKTDGTLWAFGANDLGQIGAGAVTKSSTPVQIADKVASMAAGNAQIFFIKKDKTLWAAGANSSGQLGVGGGTDQFTPVQVASDVVQVAAGYSHTLFIKTDGWLWGMGSNAYGELGTGSGAFYYSPGQLTLGVVEVAAGLNFSLFRKTDGSVWTVGRNASGQLGTGDTTDRSTQVQVAVDAAQVATGVSSSYIVKANGTLLVFGGNSAGHLGTGVAANCLTPTAVATNVTAVQGYGSHMVFLKAEGTAWAAGAKNSGQFGDGFKGILIEPKLVADEVVSFAAGGSEVTLYVKSDGTLWGMGRNNMGQLGDGSTLDRYAPVLIDTNVTTVDAGGGHNIYLKADNTLWGMGNNGSGQLGDGTQLNRLTPVMIATDVAEAVARTSGSNTYFRKTNGTWWGTGFNGATNVLEAGTGASAVTTPVQLSPAGAMAGGNSFRLFIKPDTTLWGIGANYYGQVGTGGSSTVVNPQQVATGVIGVYAGSNTSFYLTTDGVLHGMGDNSYGQLGNGSVVFRQLTPATIMNEPAKVFAAGPHTLFLKSNGGLWASGYNAAGQLGDGTTTDRSTPVRVADGVVSASAAGVHSLFLKRGLPTSPSILHQPEGREVTAGQQVELMAVCDGLPAPHYQWRRNGAPVDGATAARFELASATASDAGDYDVVVTNAFGSVTSVQVVLTVKAPLAPSILSSPTGAYQIVGGAHTLTVIATGAGPLAYQWYHNDEPLPGRTEATLELANLQMADAGSYTVSVKNEVSTVTSAEALIYVENLPVVTQSTTSRLIGTPGQALRLEATATSAYAPLTYQWQRNNRPIAGAQAAVYEKQVFDNADAGAYTLVITDAHGFVLRHTIFVLPRYAATGVQAWGDNTRGQTSVPTGLTDIMSVAAGSMFSMAVRADGKAVAWGGFPELYPYATAVSALQGVVEVSCGGDNAFILTADGQVSGLNFGAGAGLSPPAGLTGVIAVAPRLALKSDGTLAAWSGAEINMPVGLSDGVAVASGDSHFLVLKSDGTVVAWGSNAYQQSTVPAGLSQVKAIAAGGNLSMALKEDGTVVTWGAGQTAPGAGPQGLLTAKAVAAGDSKAYALQIDGRLFAWYVYTSSNTSRASLPPMLNPVLAMSVGAAHGVALTDLTAEVEPETPGPNLALLSQRRQVLIPGQPMELAVTATGSGAVTYQWYRNGRKLDGATMASFTVPAVAMKDGGYYWVKVTDEETTKQSPTLFVIVAPAVTEIRGWGSNGGGQLTLPSSLVRPVAVAAGSRYALALEADGRVLGWGGNSYPGPRNAPAELKDAVAIAASERYSLALRSNGRVVAWGEVPSETEDLLAELRNVVAISAGLPHPLALRSDGTVVGWDDYGYRIPAGLNDVVAISSGRDMSMALKEDGTVASWGSDDYGKVSFVQGLTGIMGISAGSLHALVLKQDGTVKGGGYTAYKAVTPPPDLANVVSVAAGIYHSLALKYDGTVVAWGGYYVGESTPPVDLSDVIQVAVPSAVGGELCSLALRDATPYVAPFIRGQPLSQIRNATQTAILTVLARGEAPLTYLWRKNGEPIDGANTASLTLADLTLSDAGNYDVVVTNHAGSTTSETATLTVASLPIITNQGSTRRVPLVGQPVSLEMKAIGTGPMHYQWTRNGYPIPGATDRIYNIPAATFQDAGCYVLQITDDAGIRRSAPLFVLVRFPKSQVVTWGSSSQSIPVDLTDAVAIATGQSHGLAVRADGSLIGWGNSSNYMPLPVAPEGFVAVSIESTTGSNLALKADGTVVSWQNYGSNQGPTGLKDVVSVASNYTHAWALKSDGTVRAWNRGSPDDSVALPDSLQNVVSIVADTSHALALQRDGTVLGIKISNVYGQSTMPANVTGGKILLTSKWYSLVLKTDGSFLFWGDNYGGQDSPPAGLSGVRALVGGGTHALALKNDGIVVGWGRSLSAATPPSGLEHVVAIAACNDVSLALRDAIAPIFISQPMHRAVQENSPASFLTSVSGSPAPTYQWQIRMGETADWTNLIADSVYTGVTTTTLDINAVTPALTQNRYRLVASNTAGNAVSNEVTLSLLESYAGWQADQFTSSEVADPAISGANADPDGDGYSNLLEYALGLEAKAVNGSDLAAVSVSTAEWIYTYSRPADRVDVGYEVQVSTNLVNWSTSGVVHERITTDGVTEQWKARYPLSTANVFFRLKVTQAE